MSEQNSTKEAEESVLVSGVMVREQFRSPVHIITVQLSPDVRLDIPMLHLTWHNNPLTIGANIMVRIPPSAIHLFP